MTSLSEKINQQQDKENKLNPQILNTKSDFKNNFSSFSVKEDQKDRLPAIHERDTENHSVRLITEENENKDYPYKMLNHKENKKLFILKQNNKRKNNHVDFNLTAKRDNEMQEENHIKKNEKNIKMIENNNNSATFSKHEKNLQISKNNRKS